MTQRLHSVPLDDFHYRNYSSTIQTTFSLSPKERGIPPGPPHPREGGGRRDGQHGEALELQPQVHAFVTKLDGQLLQIMRRGLACSKFLLRLSISGSVGAPPRVLNTCSTTTNPQAKTQE